MYLYFEYVSECRTCNDLYWRNCETFIWFSAVIISVRGLQNDWWIIYTLWYRNNGETVLVHTVKLLNTRLSVFPRLGLKLWHFPQDLLSAEPTQVFFSTHGKNVNFWYCQTNEGLYWALVLTGSGKSDQVRLLILSRKKPHHMCKSVHAQKYFFSNIQHRTKMKTSI